MIHLTRLNSSRVIINSDLIKFVEQSPDTVITLLSGEKILVQETVAEVVERVIAYRRRVLAGMNWESARTFSPSHGAAQTERENAQHQIAQHENAEYENARRENEG